MRTEMRTCDDECKFIERLSFEGGDCDCDRGCDRDRGRGWKGIRLPEGDSGGRRRHKTEPILSRGDEGKGGICGIGRILTHETGPHTGAHTYITTYIHTYDNGG